MFFTRQRKVGLTFPPDRLSKIALNFGKRLPKFKVLRTFYVEGDRGLFPSRYFLAPVAAFSFRPLKKTKHGAPAPMAYRGP